MFKKQDLLMSTQLYNTSTKDKCCEFIRINDAQVNYFCRKKFIKMQQHSEMGSQPKKCSKNAMAYIHTYDE